uniref:Sushi domain-containing protein 2 n=1 Tax=Oryzias latipes TaxID=8090 RepID=A0A3P9H7J0_ORYLA
MSEKKVQKYLKIHKKITQLHIKKSDYIWSFRGIWFCSSVEIPLSLLWTGETCEGKCGQQLDSCSCHPTCGSLKSCCPDYKEFCIDVAPQSGSILGGTDFFVLEANFTQSSQIVCRFNSEIDTEGFVDDSGRAHCISPLLYQTGWVPLHISSDNGTTFSRSGAWLSVHTGKLSSEFKALLVNSTKWQYYGTPGVGGYLQMTWNTTLVNGDKVNIELWGYREMGEPYSENWQGEMEYLYSLAKDQPNNGSFSFLPKIAENGFSSWELGSVRVSSSSYPDGMRNVQAAWTEDHALAWHLEQKFRDNSTAWALEKCLAWDQLEVQLPNFLNEIIDCPCTLAQARADTGRFHTDYGCDIEKGSVCTYHPGSVHCVRAIQASPQYAAGQQCCYDKTGAQVLTADSIGGSTPDRAHDWGSPPFRKPPRIPGLSHWVYDVLSFYYCCLWSDNCHYYFKHRPSSDCRRYQSPNSAVVFGDPHFITFDGVSYSFNGKGEYTLVTSADKQLTIQGRTEPIDGNAIKATKMSAVAMREASSDIIEVRLASGDNRLEVLRNQKSLSFAEQTWMDLQGVFVFSPTSSNVTVMFPSGAGVEVRQRGKTLTTTVLLPEEFGDSTQGLLGNMNGDAKDDLALSNGELVQNQSNAEELFAFGASWAVPNASALFTYDSNYLLETYYFVPRHDPSFIPAFSAPEDPDDPLSDQAAEICSGESSPFCRYDILVGRSLTMGNDTRRSFQSHISLVEDLKPVISCGWLPPPNNGKKQGTTYLQGARVQFSCNEGYTLKGSAERICQKNAQWSGEEASCVVPTLILIITMIVLHFRKQKR